ncbi:hypothetical protein AGMMS50267_17650 [Spirochaetia bacterium]|nr:hypothetical protein AGMMS50267_17650 [Spirochaetia bacterium]
MSKKSLGITALLFVIGFGVVSALDTGNGQIDVTLEMKLNIMDLTTKAFSDEDLRPGANQHGNRFFQFGLIEPESWLTKDAFYSFGYQTERVGGYIKWKGLTGIVGKAWVSAGPLFKITVGNDIESLYADPLGADPGLRIYNGGTSAAWDASLNPDNITQDRGLLVEGFFGPVSAALSGNVSSSLFGQTGANGPVAKTLDPENLKWLDTDSRQMMYSGRIGSEIGSFGKVNASYILYYWKNGNAFNPDSSNEKLVAMQANAEVYTHLFGIYASLTPLENLGLTLGYGGILTKYLDEFETSGGTAETLFPQVLQNALMLNARYTNIVPGLTVRTDHNYSFWTDKNYAALGGNGFRNYNYEATAPNNNSAEVGHWLLWNGIGVVYEFNSLISVELYVRNLYRFDSAEETNGKKYELGRDELSVEPKVYFYFTPQIKAYAGVTLKNTVATASEYLNEQGRNNAFKTGTAPKDTKDSVFVMSIPIGVTMQF